MSRERGSRQGAVNRMLYNYHLLHVGGGRVHVGPQPVVYVHDLLLHLLTQMHLGGIGVVRQTHGVGRSLIGVLLRTHQRHVRTWSQRRRLA